MLQEMSGPYCGVTLDWERSTQLTKGKCKAWVTYLMGGAGLYMVAVVAVWEMARVDPGIRH